jgi:hypothetical protein
MQKNKHSAVEFIMFKNDSIKKFIIELAVVFILSFLSFLIFLFL